MDAETTLAPIVSSNLNELIRARLKDYIVQNNLRAGDKLPTEEQLSQRLGVSRTAVREALRSLEALGVVEARQGYGRVVCSFNFQAILNNLSYGLVFQNNDILQITDIRKALDSYFTGQAIQNLSEQDVAELAYIVGIMEERSRAGLGISEQDHRFHQLLFQRCNNPLALQLFEITWTVRLNAYDRDSALRESPPGTAHEHTAILEAILRKDVETARQLMLDHHWNTEERFRGRIKQEMQRTEMRRIREEVREETTSVEP